MSAAEAIKMTIARFDVFDFPLTDFEIWQFLPIKLSYNEVRHVLETTPLESQSGFYFLSGQSKLLAIRQTRYRDSEDKINKAKRRLKLISWLPFIRLIALANVIGAHNLKKNSDIDLFIVTKANRLWTVKLLASFILKIFNLRPTKENSKDKLCLSFLVDETALNLESCRQTNDWYFSYWLAGLVPISGSMKVYEKLIQANTWLETELPNWQRSSKPRYRFRKKPRQENSSSLWNQLESTSERIHRKLMSPALVKADQKTTSVIISKHILKLHSFDRRSDIFLEAEKRYAKLQS